MPFYSVVKFYLPIINHRNYICVPSSWIVKDWPEQENGVIIKYPRLHPVLTSQHIRNKDLCENLSFYEYKATKEFTTDDYEQVDNWLKMHLDPKLTNLDKSSSSEVPKSEEKETLPVPTNVDKSSASATKKSQNKKRDTKSPSKKQHGSKKVSCTPEDQPHATKASVFEDNTVKKNVIPDEPTYSGRKVGNSSRSRALASPPDQHNSKRNRTPSPVHDHPPQKRKLISYADYTRRDSEDNFYKITRSNSDTSSTKRSVDLDSTSSQDIWKIDEQLVISTTNLSIWGDDLIESIKKSLDIKKSGVKVENLKLFDEHKALLTCTSEELAVVKSLLNTNKYLTIKEKKGNPCVIIYDVDETLSLRDILDYLWSQNKDIFKDFSQENFVFKYLKKEGNGLQKQFVFDVDPVLHKRLVEKGAVHVDVRKYVVGDFTPLTQCSKCLMFNHTYKSCDREATICRHCAKDGHHKLQCRNWQQRKPPVCINCYRAYGDSKNFDHEAFSPLCPVKIKWDQIIRARTEYLL